MLAPGDYTYPGADLGMLVARSRMEDDDGRLTDRARRMDRRHPLAVRAASAAGSRGERARRTAGALAFKSRLTGWTRGARLGARAGRSANVCVWLDCSKRSNDCSHLTPGQRYSTRPSAGKYAAV